MSKWDVRGSESWTGSPRGDCCRLSPIRLSPISWMDRPEVQADLAPLQAERDRMRAIARVELLEHVTDMRLYGRGRDVQLRGDPGSASAACHHPEHLALSPGKGRTCFRRSQVAAYPTWREHQDRYVQPRLNVRGRAVFDLEPRAVRHHQLERALLHAIA